MFYFRCIFYTFYTNTGKMIQELTKENLRKEGYKEDDVNELYNTITTFTLQCNEGKIFVSKLENKFYTDIDFYRKTHFINGSLRFPYNYPDLVNEYFDLALAEFLQKQKTILGLLFNETDQFNKFISNEIDRSQQRIESQKEFLVKMKHHKFESKENDIKICKGYINYLKKKQQPEANNPDEVNPDEVKIIDKLKQNKFDDVQPSKVYQHFKQLVDNKYITNESFNLFLSTVFEQNKTLTTKIEIIKPNSKQRVQKIFYIYFEKFVQNKYGTKQTYIDLLCNNFTGFNSKTLLTNFAK